MFPAEDVPAAQPLRLLSLEITGKCNLTCSHCYAESGPRLSLRGEMAKADWLRVIDEAAELGCRDLTFIGGEPTLHPDLPELIERAAARGFLFIEVYTNATRLKPALLETLARHGVRLAASFYSAAPAPHEAITGVRGSWRQTVQGLEAALAAGLPVRVNIVEMAENAGQADAAIDFLRGLGIAGEIRVDRLRGIGRGAAEAAGAGEENYSALCGQCWKGKLCVTSSGETFPCELARRTRLGQAREGLGRVLGEPRLSEFRGIVRRMQDDRDNDQNPPLCGPVKKSPDGEPDKSLPGCGPIPAREPGCGPIPLNPPGCGPIPARDPACGPIPVQDPACGPIPLREPGCGPIPAGDPGICGPVPLGDPDICGPVPAARAGRGARESRPA